MKLHPKKLAWQVPVAAVAAACAAAVALLLATLFVPYHPFVFKSYVVTPSSVCPGAPVTAKITRETTTSYDALSLAETWVTVNVPGLAPDRPVAQYQGTLPAKALHPTHGFTTATSPLLDRAPDKPGTYRVRITTESHGSRWLGIPAVGNGTFYSNTVTVRPCHREKGAGK